MDITGEWSRLWNSYLWGLFKYFNFTKTVKMNIDLIKALVWKNKPFLIE